MLILDFRNSVRALRSACDIYGIEPGVEACDKILYDEDRNCKNDFVMIAESGYPHQDTARKFASLALFYLARDLRNMILQDCFRDAVKILQNQVRLVSKLI